MNIYKLQGRYDEARRLVREGWARYPDRVGTLQELVRLDTTNPDPDRARSSPTLETALGPLPTTTGSGSAGPTWRPGPAGSRRPASWLDACLGRRPDDPAVWRARLDWAEAAEDEAEVRRALAHLPADRVAARPRCSPSAPGSLAGPATPRRERRALEELDRARPGRPAGPGAAGRAARSGPASPSEAERLRGVKGELDRTLDWYVVQIFPERPARPRRRAGRAAEALGRRFEARCWWELAAERRPGRRGPRASWPGSTADGEASAAAPARPPPTCWPSSDDARHRRRLAATASGPAARRPGSSTTPRPPACASSTTTARRRSASSPRRWAAASACSTTTATAGSTSTSSRAARSRPSPTRPDAGDRLFRNRGDGTFEDVTEPLGHRRRCPAATATASPSATTTTTATPTCSSPAGGPTPSTATGATGRSRTSPSAAGLGGDRDWPTSAAFADLDGDGDLDLYVCHYLAWDAEHPRLCRDPARRRPTSTATRATSRRCPTTSSATTAAGSSTSPREAGIVDRDGRGLGVVAADLDDDGRVDLFVANDMSANYLFRNLGGFRFEEVGHAAGVAGQRRRAATRRAWASPAATSTATAGPTWP